TCPRSDVKRYLPAPPTSTSVGRNLNDVIRVLALAQQQVAVVQQRHPGEVVLGTQLNPVCPGGTLLEQAPGVAAGAGQLRGDEQFNRIAELDIPHRRRRHLAANDVERRRRGGRRVTTEQHVGSGIGGVRGGGAVN